MTEENKKKYPILAIVGPTACGKTHKAVYAAACLGGEIISADSRQVYRGMDIGTGKDLAEYSVATPCGRVEVPRHLIDIRPAGYRYNLHEYLDDFSRARAAIEARGAKVVVCGGTGLYVESALSGIRMPDVPENPELRADLRQYSLQELADRLARMKRLHNVTDIDTKARAIRAIEIEVYYECHPEAYRLSRRGEADRPDSLIVGLDISRELRRERITRRLRQRLDCGMVEEVERLLASGISPDDLIYYGLEYKYLTLHFIGRLSLEEMTRQLEIAIHQFAKRQMTWLRGMERRGFPIVWLPYDMPDPDFVEKISELRPELCSATNCE